MIRGKKITKKKLKEPDEFISLTQKAVLFITHHLKIILTWGIIVAILLMSIVIYIWWDKKNEAKANQKFGLAMEIYQRVSAPSREGSQEEYKNVLEKFNEVVTEFPRTSSGKYSLLYKGNIYLQLMEFEEAIKAYETFLKKAGGEKLFRQFGLEGLGYAYEGKKDYEKAIQTYQKILEVEGIPQWGNVYLNLGRSYEKLGKKKEALENYKAFLKDPQKSLMTDIVLRKVSDLEK